MKNLNTMKSSEKSNHLNKIMNRIKSKYTIEDVTPKGYGPEEKK